VVWYAEQYHTTKQNEEAGTAAARNVRQAASQPTAVQEPRSTLPPSYYGQAGMALPQCHDSLL